MSITKKILISAGIVIVVGVGYWLISPLFIDVEVSEKLEDIATSPMAMPVAEMQVVGSGAFEGLAGHNAEGTAKLIRAGDKYYIRFEDDFKVTNGPDLFVYLGKDGQYDGNARLAHLKGNIGSQNYEIPDTIAVDDYNEVWVWCRAFSVAFGKAVLR